MMRTRFKAALVTGTMVLTTAAASAQSSGGQTPAGTSSAGAPSGRQQATASNKQQGDSQSRRFVEHMLLANMAEIELGKMGAERATSGDVKSFAEQMVADHTRANAELMPVAQQLGVQPPAQLDAKHQKIADKLSKAQGAEFDREFMKAMLAGHKKVVDETKKMAGDRGDAPSGSSGGSGTAGAIAGATGTSGAAGSTATTASGATSISGSSGEAAAGGTSTANPSSNASTTGGAQLVREYAATTLPTVQQHLQHAEMIEQAAAKKQ
jgi:putative membrane protein